MEAYYIERHDYERAATTYKTQGDATWSYDIGNAATYYDLEAAELLAGDWSDYYAVKGWPYRCVVRSDG